MWHRHLGSMSVFSGGSASTTISKLAMLVVLVQVLASF